MTSLPPPLRALLIRDLAPLSLRRPQCHCPVRQSLFRQQQRRLQVIPPRPPPSPQPTYPQYAGQPPPPSTKLRRRWSRAIIYSALFFIAGGQLAAYGIKVSGLMTPLHEPGSPEDDAALATLERAMQRLDIVKQFGTNHGVSVEDQQAPDQQLPFIELVTRPTAHHNDAQHHEPIPSTLDPPHAIIADATELSSTLLRGSRGLGIQKAYYNPTTNDLYALVYFGPALAGWPSITHGGAIATVLEESMARCAGLVQRSGSGGQAVVGQNRMVAQDGPALQHREPENIQFRYFSPTITQRLYILHVVPLETSPSRVDSARQTETEEGRAKALQTLEKAKAENAKLLAESKGKSNAQSKQMEADGRLAEIKDKTVQTLPKVSTDMEDLAMPTGWGNWVMEDGKVKVTATLVDAKSQRTMCTATATWGPE